MAKRLKRLSAFVVAAGFLISPTLGASRYPEPGPHTWFVHSRHDFLSAFKGRCILVSGDSVSRESFWSLMLWAHGCSGDGSAPLELVDDDDTESSGQTPGGPAKPSGNVGAGFIANDVLDDGSGMGAREYHARFASRGLGRLASCAWFKAHTKDRARRDIRVPVDSLPEHDVRVRWYWAPYVADLLRAGAVASALDTGACDLFILNAGFWNLRRARNAGDRVHPELDVRDHIAALDGGGRARAVAARHSLVWRSCTYLEADPEPDNWFDNRHIGVYNLKVDRAWRARGFAVVNPLRLFVGIKEATPPRQFRYTRDGIHPAFTLHVRMLREALSQGLWLKLRAQAGGRLVAGPASLWEEWAPPAPTPYPPLSPPERLEALAAWSSEVRSWRAAHGDGTTAPRGGGGGADGAGAGAGGGGGGGASAAGGHELVDDDVPADGVSNASSLPPVDPHAALASASPSAAAATGAPGDAPDSDTDSDDADEYVPLFGGEGEPTAATSIEGGDGGHSGGGGGLRGDGLAHGAGFTDGEEGGAGSSLGLFGAGVRLSGALQSLDSLSAALGAALLAVPFGIAVGLLVAQRRGGGLPAPLVAGDVPDATSSPSASAPRPASESAPGLQAQWVQLALATLQAQRWAPGPSESLELGRAAAAAELGGGAHGGSSSRARDASTTAIGVGRSRGFVSRLKSGIRRVVITRPPAVASSESPSSGTSSSSSSATVPASASHATTAASTPPAGALVRAGASETGDVPPSAAVGPVR